MPRLPRPPVQRTRTGFRINLDVEERDLIQRLLDELGTLLTAPLAQPGDEPRVGDGQASPALDAPMDDPRLRRLFPSAYHLDQDRELDAEFRRLMGDELIASRLAGLALIGDALSPRNGRMRELTESEMLALLQALNGVRLVLGTLIDVSEDHDLGAVDDDDPLIAELHLYDFLSWVLDSCVRALQS